MKLIHELLLATTFFTIYAIFVVRSAIKIEGATPTCNTMIPTGFVLAEALGGS